MNNIKLIISWIILFTVIYSNSFYAAQSVTEANPKFIYSIKNKFESFTTKQGLSQNSIYTIMQDSKGFLWFGTQGGVNRFNGYNFKVFSHNAFDTTSLRHNYINKIYEDSQQRIWVCTEDGLSLFNQETESFINYVHNKSDSSSLNNNYVWTIIEDSKGVFWVGTKKGLSRFDVESGSFVDIQITTKDNIINFPVSVNTILEDSKSNLWITIRGKGIYKVIRGNKNLTKSSELEAVYYKPGNGDVRTIIENTHGEIFVGVFGSGLFSFNSFSNSFRPINIDFSRNSFVNPKNIRSLYHYREHENILWIGTEEDGLILFDLKENSYRRFLHDQNITSSLNGNMIHSVLRDRSGIIWIGTNEGINQLNLYVNEFEHYQVVKNKSKSLTANAIGTMLQDENGLIWIGTDGGGINVLDRTSNEVRSFQYNKFDNSSIASNRAMNIFEDHRKNIWVGTYGGGLNKLIKETNSFIKFIHDKSNPKSISSNYITSIVEDNNGHLWIGTTDGGINHYNPDNDEFTSYLNNASDIQSLSDNHVWILFIDSENTLWAGTRNGGLNKMINPDTGTFKRYTHEEKDPNSIISNTVFDIFEDSNGKLWIGTNGGLSKLDKNNDVFVDFRQSKFFSQLSITGILEDRRKRLWVMTGKSLIRFNPETEKIKIYDNENDMPINDFRIWAHYKNPQDEMFVGGANGFAIFNPEDLIDNKFIPPVVIDHFERFNIDDLTGQVIVESGIPYKSEIELSYKDNIFSFSFAALNFVNPLKNQYAYKLDGFNEEWIQIGNQNRVTFTNIDPGNYILKVKGSNDDGVWNEKVTELSIMITPPFWDTLWFKTSMLLGVILIIGSYVKSKLSEANKRHQEQLIFARQLIETEESERRRIANELHDSLGQNLLVIKNSILLKQQQAQITGSSLSEMSDMVTNAIQEVRSISHNLRPHLLDQLGISKTIKALINQLNESTEISFSAKVEDIANLLEPKAEINLFRIIQESFNNIIKHSQATKADLKLHKLSDTISLTIKDNGIGMGVKKLNTSQHFGQGFGLYGIEKRASVFGWIVKIDSIVNKGTEINITIPLKGIMKK